MGIIVPARCEVDIRDVIAFVAPYLPPIAIVTGGYVLRVRAYAGYCAWSVIQFLSVRGSIKERECETDQRQKGGGSPCRQKKNSNSLHLFPGFDT
jgi:hypothetical protein